MIQARYFNTGGFDKGSWVKWEKYGGVGESDDSIIASLLRDGYKYFNGKWVEASYIIRANWEFRQVKD